LLGIKGTRVLDFGWQRTTKRWGTREAGEIRLLPHATDPDYLERRLGHAASKGCVRIPDAMNGFLDRHGVLEAATSGPQKPIRVSRRCCCQTGCLRRGWTHARHYRFGANGSRDGHADSGGASHG
jgi:hypothetical protein